MVNTGIHTPSTHREASPFMAISLLQCTKFIIIIDTEFQMKAPFGPIATGLPFVGSLEMKKEKKRIKRNMISPWLTAVVIPRGIVILKIPDNLVHF